MTFLTEEQTRTEIITLVRTAWELGPPTDTIPLAYEGVKFDKPTGADANGKALPWARVSVRIFGGSDSTLGGTRYGYSGMVTVEVYTADGDGYEAGGAAARIPHLALRGKQTPGGAWFFDVSTTGKGTDGPWLRMEVTANFRFEDG